MRHERMNRWTAVLTLAIMLIYSTTPVSAIEIAEELFVDLRASTYNTDDANWMNAGNYANFEAIDSPVRLDFAGVNINGDLGTTPAIAFNGSTQAFVGGSLDDPESAPEGLTGFDPTRTIEVWALNPSIAGEENLYKTGLDATSVLNVPKAESRRRCDRTT